MILGGLQRFGGEKRGNNTTSQIWMLLFVLLCTPQSLHGRKRHLSTVVMMISMIDSHW